MNRLPSEVQAKTKIELGEGARKRGREPVDILLMPPCIYM